MFAKKSVKLEKRVTREKVNSEADILNLQVSLEKEYVRSETNQYCGVTFI
jgi:hypothetical protein